MGHRPVPHDRRGVDRQAGAGGPAVAFADALGAAFYDGLYDCRKIVRRVEDPQILADFVRCADAYGFDALASEAYVEALKLWMRYCAAATTETSPMEPDAIRPGNDFTTKLYVSLGQEGVRVLRVTVEGVPEACREQLLATNLAGLPFAIIGTGRGSAGVRIDVGENGAFEDRTSPAGRYSLSRWAEEYGSLEPEEGIALLVEHLRGQTLGEVAPGVEIEGMRGLVGEAGWMVGL